MIAVRSSAVGYKYDLAWLSVLPKPVDEAAAAEGFVIRVRRENEDGAAKIRGERNAAQTQESPEDGQ